MDINDRENLIFKLSTISEEEQLADIDVSFHLVRKQNEADNEYQTLEVQLSSDVRKWLKTNIIESLNKLKQQGEHGNNVFNVGDYNYELSINDKIAKFSLNTNASLLTKKEMLINSIRHSDVQYAENKTNFQIVVLTYQENMAYFCYYRGIKRNTSKSNKRAAFKNTNQFQFVEDRTVIDIGGSFDYFIVDDYIFILNAKNFEYAFNYRDHINNLRDQHLTTIISMPFFDDTNKTIFENSCKQFFYSRTLAQIKTETLTAIQENFNERCSELLLIKTNTPENLIEKEKYIKKYGTLWELFDYIDVENCKIIFNEDYSPKPLIHFFADKIVKSFLTEEIKVASAYE